jgi:hypothetical protein
MSSRWQREPLGPRGATPSCAPARTLVGDDGRSAFLPDDIIVSRVPCMRQLLDVHARHGGPVLAVMRVPREEIGRRRDRGGRRSGQRARGARPRGEAAGRRARSSPSSAATCSPDLFPDPGRDAARRPRRDTGHQRPARARAAAGRSSRSSSWRARATTREKLGYPKATWRRVSPPRPPGPGRRVPRVPGKGSRLPTRGRRGPRPVLCEALRRAPRSNPRRAPRWGPMTARAGRARWGRFFAMVRPRAPGAAALALVVFTAPRLPSATACGALPWWDHLVYLCEASQFATPRELLRHSPACAVSIAGRWWENDRPGRSSA